MKRTVNEYLEFYYFKEYISINSQKGVEISFMKQVYNLAEIEVQNEISPTSVAYHLTYPHQKFQSHMDGAILDLFVKLRQMNRKGLKQWEEQIDRDVERLFKKWNICAFVVNRDAYTGLVLECKSGKYGDVVIKMYPPFLSARFIKESFIYFQLKDYPQAPLLDVDVERNAMLLKRIIPGDYIVYEEDRAQIAKMFLSMKEHRVEAADITSIPKEIKGVVDQTEDELLIAVEYDYYPDVVKRLVKAAKKIYEEYFSKETKYLIHGDAYYKNALRGSEIIYIIDPVGYVDAFIFEYMPLLTYELVMHTEPSEYGSKYTNLVNDFDLFTDTKKFNAATFVFLIKQLVPSIFEANDGYKRANKYMGLIEALFFDDEQHLLLNKY